MRERGQLRPTRERIRRQFINLCLANGFAGLRRLSGCWRSVNRGGSRQPFGQFVAFGSRGLADIVGFRRIGSSYFRL